jgi:uncharacterized phage-associated protein
MFRPILNEKIGNTLIYFSERITDLYLTKALKLLYFLDETSIKETGMPFTWLEYKVWKLGPVAEEIHNELRHKRFEIYGDFEFSLKNYVQTTRFENPVEAQFDSFKVEPIKAFDKGEFSEYELALLAKIVKRYGSLSSKQLVNTLHQEGTLWDKLVTSNDLVQMFKTMSRSDITIPFHQLVQDDEMKEMAYSSAYEALSFQEEMMFADAY